MELEQARAHWETLGAEDPLWAVLTEPGRRGRRWTEEEFLQSGREEIDAVFAMLERIGHLPPSGEAVDFGCGAGRLTQALAARFDLAVGVDGAASMVETARRMNRQGERCVFVQNTSGRLEGLADDRFAMAYTCRVLQHIPPQAAHGYIAELVRVLRPDGVLVFQIPERPSTTLPGLAMRILPQPAVNALRRAYQRSSSTMEMHGTRRADVEALVARHGGRVVHVQPDDAAGPHWRSFTYVVRR